MTDSQQGERNYYYLNALQWTGRGGKATEENETNRSQDDLIHLAHKAGGSVI